MSRSAIVRAMFAAVLLAVTAPRAHAGPQFLTIGGGYSPTGNQVSIEKNVQFYQRLLDELGLGGCPHHLLFADGDDPGRDTQVQDPAQAAPRINKVLASIFGSAEHLDHRYRGHQVERVNGPSAIGPIDAWFAGPGAALTADDPVMIYFTGHGGRGDTNDNHNTTLMLWNNAPLKMKDFARRLDKLNRDTPVVLLMVQCYAGGFADVIYSEGDPAKGLSDHNRCGFFATVHDRPAAGCTPDINEDSYEDYSTYFLAALHGQTRTGQKIEPPDYDGDGTVDFTEAHAYALITSDSIDISVRTSDILLRKYSTTEAKLGEKEIADPLTATADYTALLAAAGPCERAILDGLSGRLELDGEDRAARVAELVKKAEEDRNRVKGEANKLNQEVKKLRKQLGDDLRKRYPEIGNPWHPFVQELLRDEGESKRMLTEIESHPTWRKIDETAQQVRTLREQEERFEHRWVKLRRFQWTAETIALAANIEKAADAPVVDRYRRMIASERATLKSSAPAPIPPGPTHYKGRQIATTMHWLGAEWLTRDSREKEENATLLMKNLGVKEGDTVCDLGAGNGYYTLKLARMVGPEGKVIATDIQPEMLDMLRKRAEARDIKHIETVLGSLVDTGLKANTCDLILLVDVYHEFSHPEQMLASIRKALKPGGRLALVEFRAEDPDVPIKPLHKMSKQQILKELPANGLKLAGEFDDLPWQHLMFFTRDEDWKPDAAAEGEKTE